MAILNFDPADAAGKSQVARGVYQYRVVHVEERTFGTGKLGATVHMDVFLPDRVIKVYENVFYTPKALWKIEELCNSIGANYRKGMDTKEFIGESGQAFFGRKKNEKFLTLMEFIPKEGGDEASHEETSFAKEPPAFVAEEDVPF